MQSPLQLKIEEGYFQNTQGGRGDAYFDVDGLHALGAAEFNVTGYRAVSAIRWHRRVWLLLAKGKCDEIVASHEHTHWHSPTRACSSGGEDTL